MSDWAWRIDAMLYAFVGGTGCFEPNSARKKVAQIMLHRVVASLLE